MLLLCKCVFLHFAAFGKSSAMCRNICFYPKQLTLNACILLAHVFTVNQTYDVANTSLFLLSYRNSICDVTTFSLALLLRVSVSLLKRYCSPCIIDKPSYPIFCHLSHIFNIYIYIFSISSISLAVRRGHVGI